MSERRRGQERRQVMYTFIAHYIEEHHYAPTFREIMQHVGLKSTSRVAYHVAILKKQGLITSTDNTYRTIQVVKP